jgi:hypothetical protein
MKADYSYFADSCVAAKDDLVNNAFDRTNKHDFAGRLAFNQFGMGQASDPTVGYKRVYEQTITYDAFSQITSRQTVHWDDSNGFAATYTNGRKNPMTNEGLTFDASGNIVHRGDLQTNPHEHADTIYDASGKQED